MGHRPHNFLAVGQSPPMESAPSYDSQSSVLADVTLTRPATRITVVSSILLLLLLLLLLLVATNNNLVPLFELIQFSPGL